MGFEKTSSIVATRAFIQELLEYLISTAAPVGAGPLDGLAVKFYTDGPALNPDMILGDFTLAALGSAGIPLDPWSAVLNLPGNRSGVHFEADAVAGAGPTAENILGAVIVDAATGLVLKGAVQFPEPVPISDEGDFVSLDTIFALPTTLATGV